VASLIHPNGDESIVHPLDKKRGFSLQELYRLLDCTTVQAISLADGRTMWMDEEAKLKNGLQFVNDEATKLLIDAGGVLGDEIIGSVLITSEDEVG
jgi:hypothetical protein